MERYRNSFKLIGLFILFSVIVDCHSSKRKEIANTEVVKMTTSIQSLQDSVDFYNKAVFFLQRNQNFLKNNQLDSIANNVLFPLNNSCLLARVFGNIFIEHLEEYPTTPFPLKVDRKIFIEKNDSIYKPFIRALIIGVDVKEEIFDINGSYNFTTQWNKDIWEINIEVILEFREVHIYINKTTGDSEDKYGHYFCYQLDASDDTFYLIAISCW